MNNPAEIQAADVLAVADILDNFANDRAAMPPRPNDIRAFTAWARARALGDDKAAAHFVDLVGRSMTAAHKLAQNKHSRMPSNDQVAAYAVSLARSAIDMMNRPADEVDAINEKAPK